MICISFGFISIFVSMGGLINLGILQELEEELERDENNMQRRILRDNSDPFQIPEGLFIKYYRFDRQSTRNIIDMLRPHLTNSQRVTAVPTELKVLTMLYFLGHGSYQKCIGLNLNLSLEQSTVSNIIAETCDAVVNLIHHYIKFPEIDEERNNIKQGFFEKYRFPGIIAAIDCTHIAIVAPSFEDQIRPGIAYYNRKGYYSINVQMICDSNLVITNCNARFPGSTHDSAIWSLSPVRNHLVEEFMNGANVGSWLIGDAGYPLEPWLLVPQDYVDLDTPEARYTQCHIRARNCIERCFGVLKQRFRCLPKHRVLHYDPSKAAKIIYSCAVLHNISIQHNLQLPEENEVEQEVVVQIYDNEELNVVNNPVMNNRLYQEGIRRINILKNTYFVN